MDYTAKELTHIFIVNPYAGNKNGSSELREKLAKIEGIKYFVFNTRGAGKEAELVRSVRKIFEDEPLRFYCVGGSGTLRNMLNGFEDLSEAEIAFYPCGLTNDFLKVFGDVEEKFRDIEELIYGDIINVDYIQTNHGVVLNTLTVGADAEYAVKMEDYRMMKVLGNIIPYGIAGVHALFIAKHPRYEIEVDGKVIDDRASELFFGNGYALGGFMFLAKKEETSVMDGKANYRFIKHMSGFSATKLLLEMRKGNYKNADANSYYGMSSEIVVRRKDGEAFAMNQDGELIQGGAEWRAHIVNKGLRFVVPKGVPVEWMK